MTHHDTCLKMESWTSSVFYSLQWSPWSVSMTERLWRWRRWRWDLWVATTSKNTALFWRFVTCRKLIQVNEWTVNWHTLHARVQHLDSKNMQKQTGQFEERNPDRIYLHFVQLYIIFANEFLNPWTPKLCKTKSKTNSGNSPQKCLKLWADLRYSKMQHVEIFESEI